MSHQSIGSQLGAGGELTTVEESLVQALGGLTYTTGDILYYSGSQLTNLGIGSSGQVLTVSSGIPAWVNASSAGTSTTFVDGEVPSGVPNGARTLFTLANTPTSGSVRVFLNGARQQIGAGNDYSISGANITFASAPLEDSVILADYRY